MRFTAPKQLGENRVTSEQELAGLRGPADMVMTVIKTTVTTH